MPRTVRVREKRTIVTGGPFAETKEQIAGFDVLVGRHARGNTLLQALDHPAVRALAPLQDASQPAGQDPP